MTNKKTTDQSATKVVERKSAAEAIKEIERIRERPVIAFTAERRLGYWDIPLLYKVLSDVGKQPKLSIILQSIGGFADDTFKMANLIHEFADQVAFLVPTYAKSAATLLCLSGNEILMGPISELGPTNPMMSVDQRLITPSLPQTVSPKWLGKRGGTPNTSDGNTSTTGFLEGIGSA